MSTASMAAAAQALPEFTSRFARKLGRRGAAFILGLGLTFFLYLSFELTEYHHTFTALPLSVTTVIEELHEAPLGEPLGSHLYQEDGLLVVNADGPHPIYELIHDAEAAWNDRIRRASQTLEQAVAEYRRRYQRDPPIGFDHWWEYAQRNNVQLPDEYDSIHDSLEYLWGIDPHDLEEQELAYEGGRSDSFTIGKSTQDEPISMLNTSYPENQRDQLYEGAVVRHLRLVSEVEQYIPPFRAVFSPNDNPNQVVDYHIQSLLLKAAREKTYMSVKSFPPVNYTGWASPCSLESSARIQFFNHTLPAELPSAKTFIHDHKRTMNVCDHPQTLRLHGQFLSHSPDPPVPEKRFSPQFSNCRTALHRDIAVATDYGWVGDVPEDVPWEDKVDERLLWRGSTTGMWYDVGTLWRRSHRSRLVNMTNSRHGSRTVLSPTHSDEERVGPGREFTLGRLNPATMDIAFAGDIIQCAPETCELLGQVFDFRRRQEQKEASLYKYVLDVDGNGWSGRYKRLMATNSLIFKSTIYLEWFAERIAPWVHYVPVQVDYSDLYDVLTFFRGNFDGENAHDDLARKIGEAGKEWSRQFWRKEDMTAYMFRLYLEYARVMSVDRESMSYVL